MVYNIKVRLTYSILLVSSLAFSENRVKVAVIDSGIRQDSYLKQYMCNIPPIDLTNTGIYDNIGHGTNISAAIVDGLDSTKVCLIEIKFFDSKTGGNLTWIESLKRVKRLNVSYVNASLSGIGWIPNENELIVGLLNDGVGIAAAAGNDGLNLDQKCIAFPACLSIKSNIFRIVGHSFKGKPVKTSNFGKVVTDWSEGTYCYGGRCLSGTSQATARLMNKWLKVKYGKK